MCLRARGVITRSSCQRLNDNAEEHEEEGSRFIAVVNVVIFGAEIIQLWCI